MQSRRKSLGVQTTASQPGSPSNSDDDEDGNRSPLTSPELESTSAKTSPKLKTPMRGRKGKGLGSSESLAGMDTSA